MACRVKIMTIIKVKTLKTVKMKIKSHMSYYIMIYIMIM